MMMLKHMNRRTLLKAAAGAALLLPAPRAQAQYSGFRAVRFNGSNYLWRQGDLPGLPGFTTQASVAFSFNLPAPPQQHGPTEFLFAGYGPNQSFVAMFAYTGVPPWILQLSLSDSNNAIFAGVTPCAQYFDGRWHTVLGAIKAPSSVRFNIDGATAPVTIGKPPPGGYHNLGAVLAGRPIYVGGQPGIAPYGFNGSFADFYFYSHAIDITDPAIIAGFWNSKTEMPVRQGPTGQWAASGAGPGVYKPPVIPSFFLSGAGYDFPLNGAADVGKMGIVTWNPSHPFHVVGSGFTTADSDPWNDGPAAAAQ